MRYFKNWEMLMVLAIPYASKPPYYPAVTKEQAIERITLYREALEEQVTSAIRGACIQERNTSYHCLRGIEEDYSVGSGLTSYVVFTLKNEVLAVMQYRNHKGKSITYPGVNGRLIRKLPTPEQLTAIVSSYMAGFDTDVAEMLEKVESYKNK